MGRRRRSYGLSWSCRRALGLSAAKARLSRRIGIPLTRSGRQRKLGRAFGCSVLVVLLIAGAAAAIAAGFR